MRGRRPHRARLAVDGRAPARGLRSRVELLPPRRLLVGRRPLVEADGRDLRAGARRRGPVRGRPAAAGADGAGAGDDRALRALLPRHGDRGRARAGHLGDPRGVQPGRLPAPRAGPLRARGGGPVARRGGPLRLSRSGELDDAARRRGARHRRRLDAAHARVGSARDDRVVLAARRRGHHGALPHRPAREAQAPQGPPRAHPRGARLRPLARARRRRARRRRRRHPQPGRRGASSRPAIPPTASRGSRSSAARSTSWWTRWRT